MTECGITKFQERDIDLLLAEELSVNADFCDWLFTRIEAGVALEYPAKSANVSVVDDGSEADVLALFTREDDVEHRLYVEDKIDAPLMPEQLERYLRRAQGDMRKGLCASTSVVFLTPASYGAPTPPEVTHLTFEEVAEALKRVVPGPRGRYRASFLMCARPAGSAQARDRTVAKTEPFIKEWWDAVYSALEHRHPGFFVHRARYPRSTYFAPATPGQAPYLRVDFKGHKGEVDLAFKNVPFTFLQRAVSELGDAPGHVVQNGKSSVIRIDGLPKVVISDGFDAIEPGMMPLYDATTELLRYWQQHRDTFDQMVARIGGSAP